MSHSECTCPASPTHESSLISQQFRVKTYRGLLWQVHQTKGQDQSMSCWWDSLVPKKPKFWSTISKGEHKIAHSRIKVVVGTVSNTAIRVALPYVCPHLATMASSINVPLQQNLTQPKVLIRPHSIQNSQNNTSKETILPVLMMQKEIVTRCSLESKMQMPAPIQ